MKSGYFKRKLPVLFGIAIIVSIFSAAVMAQGTGKTLTAAFQAIQRKETSTNPPVTAGELKIINRI